MVDDVDALVSKARNNNLARVKSFLSLSASGHARCYAWPPS